MKRQEEQSTEKQAHKDKSSKDDKENKDSKKSKEHTEKLHEACDTRLTELTDLLKRTHAEFENYKKRVDNEKLQYLKYASSVFAAKLLPLLDMLDSAAKNNKNPEVFKTIELIRNEFTAVLRNEGIVAIEAHGQHFDPFKHEALMIEETQDAAKDNTIVEEFQKGYMLNDKVLRHSKVKVAKYREDSKKE